MEKYLIALDMDGTLLNSQGKITKRTIEVIDILFFLQLLYWTKSFFNLVLFKIKEFVIIFIPQKIKMFVKHTNILTKISNLVNLKMKLELRNRLRIK